MTNNTLPSSSFAVIGGSGAYQLLCREAFGKEEIFDALIQGIETPFGLSAPVHFFHSSSGDFFFLSRHGEKDYALTASFIPYRANMYALKSLGVQTVVSWSGPGIINEEFAPGDYFLPDDCIDETKNRKNTFFENSGIGFIRMDAPFCPCLRAGITEAMKSLSLPCHSEGVYLCTEGPRLETRAEIRKYRLFGADVVGMTLIPEVFLARELEICYASLCYLTNFAEGVKPRTFHAGTLFEGMATEEEFKSINTALSEFPDIIHTLLQNLAAQKGEKTCHCRHSLQRYKKKGMLRENFSEWFSRI